VSTAPAMHFYMVLECFTGVNEAAEEFLTCANNTAKAFLY
jgi:hypothetical protein